MKRLTQIVLAAALAVASIWFAWSRIAGIPGPRQAAPPDEMADPTISAALEQSLASGPVSAKQAVAIMDGDLVMGLVVNGQARAYPIRSLQTREVVNDELGGEPICITWCPLALSGVIFSRRQEDQPPRRFLRGPLLHQGNLTLLDSETKSFWSQLGARAYQGKLDGDSLPIMPSVQTTWAHWRDTHPDTELIDPTTPDAEPYWYIGSDAKVDVDAVDLVIGFESPAGFKAYPFSELAAEPLSDQVGDQEILVHFDPDAHAAWITDSAGELLPAITVMRQVWAAFHPRGEIHQR